MKFLASIWDSIMVSLLGKASRSLSSYPLRRVASRSGVPGGDLVLEYQVSNRDLDAIPRGQREVFVGYEAGTRHQEGPGGEGEFLTQVFGELLEGTLHPGGAHLVLVEDLTIAQDAHPDEEVPHRVRPAQNDTGPQGAAAVVDFGLRQVQRVLTLYIPRRDVVAGGVAYDLHPAVNDQHELRLRHVPVAVFADAHGPFMPHNPPTDSFEEELGSHGIVDLVVDVGLFRFEHTGFPAPLVRNPARPHLLRGLDRGQERILGCLAPGQAFEERDHVFGWWFQQEIQGKRRGQVPPVQRPADAACREVSG